MLSRHSAVLLITGGLFAAGVVAPADAQPGHGHGHGKEHCRAVHARGVGVDDGTGTTTAVIYRGRREIGTTVGTFVLGTVDAEGDASFTGTIVFTDDHGTLDAPVDGTLDVVTGEFVSVSDSVTGTGDYANVTGRVRFAGVEDLNGLTFTETVRGRLCVPKRKQH
jgi:hypothetical protein